MNNAGKKLWLVVYEKYFLFWVGYIYLLVNILFNYRIFYSQLFADYTRYGAIWGEVWMFEWLSEKFFRQISLMRNPFAATSGILYPFNIHLGATDSGYGLFFFPFQSWLTTNQIISLIIPLSLLLANIGMYALLRKFAVRKEVAFIIGLAYGNMTFLIPRLGHLNYWCIFVFPWFYVCLLTALKKKKKWWPAVGAAVFFSLALWLNFYYFFILCLSLGILGCYFAWQYYRNKKRDGTSLLPALLIFTAAVCLFQAGWIKALWDWKKFDQLPVIPGFGGAIEYSSDLLNFIIPSAYGYYTGFLGQFMAKHFAFAKYIFEDFTYPGVIILTAYLILLWQIITGKVPMRLFKQIKPFLLTSLAFIVLTLGPFLHIFGKWTLTVDDNIKLVFPLPYLIFNYLPVFNNIRVPGRLIVGFIFFAYWVTGLALHRWLKRHDVRKMLILTIVIIFVVVVDQRYQEEYPPISVFPISLYEYIREDPENFSVLPIPFTIRDGFTYFGDYQATTAHVAESIHRKPMIGGYTGRISDYKKEYYAENPMMGYFGRLIDQNLYSNPTVAKDDLDRWSQLDIPKANSARDLLDIKYVVTDDLRPYSASVSASLQQMGFTPTKKSVGYSLWEKPLDSQDISQIMMGINDRIHIGMGWEKPLDGRLMNNSASLIIKLAYPRPMRLTLDANTRLSSQAVTIFINEQQLAPIYLSSARQQYLLDVPPLLLQAGINMIHLKTSENNTARFYSITLTDK